VQSFYIPESNSGLAFGAQDFHLSASGIFQGSDSIWIPGSDKYYMKKPALNYRAIIRTQISGEYASKALSTILLS